MNMELYFTLTSIIIILKGDKMKILMMGSKGDIGKTAFDESPPKHEKIEANRRCSE